jgi:splicing factor 3B subunit 3
MLPWWEVINGGRWCCRRRCWCLSVLIGPVVRCGQVIMYGTISGAIGLLCPFASPAERDFFKRLEAALRSQLRSLTRRDHLSYRAAFAGATTATDLMWCDQGVREAVDLGELAQAVKVDGPAELLKRLEEVKKSTLSGR